MTAGLAGVNLFFVHVGSVRGVQCLAYIERCLSCFVTWMILLAGATNSFRLIDLFHNRMIELFALFRVWYTYFAVGIIDE